MYPRMTLNLKKKKKKIYVCVFICHVYAGLLEGQKRASDLLAVVGYHMWVLGIELCELCSSIRAASNLNHRTISPVPSFLSSCLHLLSAGITGIHRHARFMMCREEENPRGLSMPSLCMVLDGSRLTNN